MTNSKQTNPQTQIVDIGWWEGGTDNNVVISFQVPKIHSIAQIYCIDIAFMQCIDKVWIMAPCSVNSFDFCTNR